MSAIRFDFVADGKLDPVATREQIARRMKQAVRAATTNFILPAIQRAAPGSRAAKTIHVETLHESPDEITLGIAPTARGAYLLFTLPPGTPPHVIRPKRGKMLRFFWGHPKDGKPAGWRYFRFVLHPGYKGDDWLGRATRSMDVTRFVLQSYRE